MSLTKKILVSAISTCVAVLTIAIAIAGFYTFNKPKTIYGLKFKELESSITNATHNSSTGQYLMQFNFKISLTNTTSKDIILNGSALYLSVDGEIKDEYDVYFTEGREYICLEDFLGAEKTVTIPANYVYTLEATVELTAMGPTTSIIHSTKDFNDIEFELIYNRAELGEFKPNSCSGVTTL